MSDTWRIVVLMRGGATRASVVLARRGRDIALFDTGLAHHSDALRLALAGQGIAPADVTHVFNTHSHVDHSHNNILFARARIYCSRRDRAWTCEVHNALARVDAPALEHIAPFYPGLTPELYNAKLARKVLAIEKLLWDPLRMGSKAQEVSLESGNLPQGVAVVETPGHSPFHASFVIETAGAPVLVCGDALLLRNESEYDAPRMPAWSEDDYRRSQAWIKTFDGVVIPGHDEPFRQHVGPAPAI